MDPHPGGPDWMPITPKTGALFHADFRSRFRRGSYFGEDDIVRIDDVYNRKWSDGRRRPTTAIRSPIKQSDYPRLSPGAAAAR